MKCNQEFARLANGDIVLLFESVDCGEPLLFVVSDTNNPNGFVLIDGEYDSLGTIPDMYSQYPDLATRLMQETIAANSANPLEFVRRLM